MVCVSIVSQRHILSAVVPVNTTVSHVASDIIRCSTFLILNKIISILKELKIIHSSPMQPRATILILMLFVYSPLLPLIYPVLLRTFIPVSLLVLLQCKLFTQELIIQFVLRQIQALKVVHLRKVLLRLTFKTISAQISLINSLSICTKECILTLSSKSHPSIRIPAKTFVIPKVTGNLPSSNFDISCFSFFF